MIKYGDQNFELSDFINMENEENINHRYDGLEIELNKYFHIFKGGDEGIESIVILNNELNQEIMFFVDDNLIKIEPSCGFEIFKQNNKFILQCFSFLL